MKIVCDNCATKYSIADEKVRGKVFKIRCKKCSHIIVVKGVEGEPAPVDAGAAAPVDSTPAQDAEPTGDGWHVVINGEQVGPLSPAEVRAKFSGGEIDSETFAWKEGFGDWQRLASIDEFSDLAAAAPPAADLTRRSSAPDDLFGSNDATQAGGSNDLFGSPAGDLFAGSAAPAPAPAPQSAALFAQPAAEPARRAPTPAFGAHSLDEVAPAQAEPSKQMTGQRNENSVLFSLNNLQALASGGPTGPKPSAPPSGNAAGIDNRAGFANSQTEGSGLIDIRAMAAATLSAPTQSHSNSNDLPAFNSAPVFSPIAAPILMPSASQGPPKWVWPIVAVGGLAVVAMIGLVIVVLKKPVEAPPVVAMVTPPAATGALPAAAGTAPAAAAGTAPVTATGTAPAAVAAAGTPAAPVAAAAPAEKGAAKGAAHNAKTAAKAAPSAKAAKADTAPAPAAAAPDPTPAPAAPKKKKGADELDDLLNGATGGGDKPAKHSAPAEDKSSGGDDLPEQLTKNDIVGGMHKVAGGVHDCYAKFNVPGMVNVAVTIGKSGRVSSASATGAFAGTPTGDCVAKAVKSGSFPAFKGAPQSITYPFMMR